MPDHGVIILAAGTAARMGTAKQLLDCAGEPLLRRMARIALASQAQHVVVVLGARRQECAAAVADQPVRLIENTAWQEGLAASIRAGVAAVQAAVEGCILLLGDQPMVTTALLDQMLAAGRPIVAASYAGILGPPVFSRGPILPNSSRCVASRARATCCGRMPLPPRPSTFPLRDAISTRRRIMKSGLHPPLRRAAICWSHESSQPQQPSARRSRRRG